MSVMTFNGLPLHPLVVHLTVVTLPVLVILALLSLHPKFRDKLRWPLAVLAVFAFVLTWFTASTGENLRDHFVNVLHVPLKTYAAHADAADRLKLAAFALAAVIGVRFLLHNRGGVIRWALAVLMVVAAGAVSYYVYKTGDTGARLVYSGV